MVNSGSELKAPADSNAVHLTLQGKGGVGKTFVAAILAQYLGDGGRTVECVDADPVNQTLSQYEGLPVTGLQLMEQSRINERHLDGLMDRLLSARTGTCVIDNGSAAFVPTSNYLFENRAIEALVEAGRDVVVHCVVTGGLGLMDTMAGFAALARAADGARLVVWLNEFFGPIERDGKRFTEMKAYLDHRDKVRAILRIPRRNPDTFGHDVELMVRSHLTFGEVFKAAGWTIMARQRIRVIQRELYEQLARAGV